MQFSDIINQQEVKIHLTELVQHNRLSHALLFLGKEGSGTLPLALAFTQYVVCETVNSRQSAANSQESPSLFGNEPLDSQLTTHDSRLTTHDLQTDSCGTCPACIKA